MKFFIPTAVTPEQAEEVYAAVALRNGAPVGSRRIYAIEWIHQGEAYAARVGEAAPARYGTGAVIAILDCGGLYKVCTQNRGFAHGEGTYIGVNEICDVVYFD